MHPPLQGLQLLTPLQLLLHRLPEEMIKGSLRIIQPESPARSTRHGHVPVAEVIYGKTGDRNNTSRAQSMMPVPKLPTIAEPNKNTLTRDGTAGSPLPLLALLQHHAVPRSE